MLVRSCLALVAVLCQFDSGLSKSIDRIIFDAAPKAEMFDMFHMMPGDQVMVMTEFDMLMNLTELQRYGSGQGRTKRKAISYESLLWDNCEVNYEITAADFSTRDRGIIQQAIDVWENFTCLTFRQRTTGDRIVFRNGGGCYSRLGKVGGAQPIALAPGCRTVGIVVHEIGHAIGWFHEQARPDRDAFITINYNQIPPNWHPQFDKARDRDVDNRGVVYDYLSIMHYSGDVFGPRTIVTKDPRFQNLIGQRSGMSYQDIRLANVMYDCANKMGCQPRQCPEGAFQGKDCKCYCPPAQDIYPTSSPIRECPNDPLPQTTPSTPRPTTTTASSTTSSPPPECMDLRSNCDRLKARGRCERDSARMMVLCRKTCEFCDDTTVGKCMDADPACPLLAKSGYCNVTGIATFMRSECPESCGICTPTNPCAADVGFNSAVTSGSRPLLLFSLFALVVMALRR